MSSYTNCEPALAYRRGIVLSSGDGGTLQKLWKNACKPTADCFYEWSCTESYVNTEPDLASWTYHDTFCECPKRLMMPWLHMFCCMLVIHHKSLISGAVLNQAIVEWKCLIQDPSLDFFFFFKQVKTQYKMKLNISFVFLLTVALGVAVLVPPLFPSVLLRDRSSESPKVPAQQLYVCC